MTDTIEHAVDAIEIADTRVKEWQSAVDRIRSNITEAKAKLAGLETRRRELALDALTDPKAATAIGKLRTEQSETQLLLDDLTLALGQAGDKLRHAEHAHSEAILQLNRANAREIIDHRIEIAKRIDDVMATADALFVEFRKALHGLPDIDGGVMPSSSTIELREGEGRLRAAISPAIRRMLALPGEHVPLARGEVAVWRSIR